MTLAQVQEASYLCKNGRGPFQIFDARGKARFEGTAEEPRPGVRKGNIAGSRNVPFLTVLDSENRFKSNEELEKLFEGLD